MGSKWADAYAGACSYPQLTLVSLNPCASEPLWFERRSASGSAIFAGGVETGQLVLGLAVDRLQVGDEVLLSRDYQVVLDTGILRCVEPGEQDLHRQAGPLPVGVDEDVHAQR